MGYLSFARSFWAYTFVYGVKTEEVPPLTAFAAE